MENEENIQKQEEIVEVKEETKKATSNIALERQVKFLKTMTSLSTTITLIVLLAIILMYTKTMSSYDTSPKVILGNYELNISDRLEVKELSLNQIILKDLDKNATMIFTFSEEVEKQEWNLSSGVYTCAYTNINDVGVTVSCQFDDNSKNISEIQTTIDEVSSSVLKVRDSEFLDAEEESTDILATFGNYEVVVTKYSTTQVEGNKLLVNLDDNDILSILIMEKGYSSALDGLIESIEKLNNSGNTSVISSGDSEVDGEEWFILNQDLNNGTAKYLCVQQRGEDGAIVIEIIYNMENEDAKSYLEFMNTLSKTLKEIE